MNSNKLRLILAVLLLAAFSTVGALPLGSTTPQDSVSIHLTLGNPSGATDSTSNKDNFLMVKDQYALSFNNSRGGPNWVSWHLQASDIGKEDRAPTFSPDTTLPAGFKRIVTKDYTGSGFDRGHICNSKDRTNTRANNDATFLLTNILPQGPGNNQGPWVRLENFERELANQGNEVYIVAGAFGEGGTGQIKPKNKKAKLVNATTIAGGKITVPKTFWKVMVILPAGENDTSRINANTRVIAVCMVNKTQIRPNDWHTFITTIQNVEAATGYDLLSELPSGVQTALASKRDSSAVGPANKNPCQ
jgi:endonuclease G, mitochondrial